jgi:hypothetical protein
MTPPAHPTPCRGLRCSALAEPLAVAAAGAAAFGAVRLIHPNPAITLACPSLTLFGVFCPLCGGTRGAYSLMTGDLAAMLGYNALLPVLLILATWGWIAWTTRRLGWSAVPGIPRRGLVFASFGALALVYGVARNFPWEPFTLLAP